MIELFDREMQLERAFLALDNRRNVFVKYRQPPIKQPYLFLFVLLVFLITCSLMVVK